jgi:hypothetical protein
MSNLRVALRSSAPAGTSATDELHLDAMGPPVGGAPVAHELAEPASWSPEIIGTFADASASSRMADAGRVASL